MILRFVTRAFNNINNLKIYKKTMLVFITLFFIPISSFLLFSYGYVTNEFKEKAIFYMQKSSDQVSKIMDSMFFNINDIKKGLISNPKLREVVEKDTILYSLNEQLDDRSEIVQILLSLKNNWNVEKVSIYLDNNFDYLKDYENIFAFKDVENEIWINEILKGNDSSLWLPSSHFDQNYGNIVYLAKFMNPNNHQEIIGVIRIDVRKEWIDEVLYNSISTENSIIYIQNNIGEIVTITNEGLLTDINILDQIYKEEDLVDRKIKQYNIDNNLYMLSSKMLNNDDWEMITLIPYDSIAQTGNDVFYRQLMVVLLGTICVILTGAFFSKKFAKKVDNLILRMKAIRHGNYNTIISNPSKDEIGEIIENYNYMVTTINQVIEEKFIMGKEVKNAEIRLLQAQINPHFLYNTLDLIQCLAIENDTNTLVTVINALAKYYKLSLNKGEEIVSLDDEINHIKEYINIQKIRFDLDIQLILNIDTDKNNLLLPKLTLQPLVENSILHGILPKLIKSGTISINAFCSSNENVIEIIDDGMGIEEDKINSVLNKGENNNFAIWNVNERIKLIYGKEYGLNYSSAMNIGTKVNITLPLSK